jgi:hypothetical protein
MTDRCSFSDFCESGMVMEEEGDTGASQKEIQTKVKVTPGFKH